MTPNEFGVICEKIRHYTDYIYLHLMGEPLLHKDLDELLSIAKAHGFKVCITTNGTLLDKKACVLEKYADIIHKISVSLHSFEGNEDAENLEAYVSLCARACIELAQKGVICAFRLWNEGGKNEKNTQIFALLSQEFEKNVADIPLDVRGNRKLGQRLYLESAEKFDWPDMAASEGGVEFCLGLRQQAAVLCDGTVVPCCLDGEGQIPLGNLFTQEFHEIMTSPRAQAIVDGFSRRQPTEELCRRCGYARRFSKG